MVNAISHPHSGDPLLALEHGAAAMLGESVVHVSLVAAIREESGHAPDGLHEDVCLGEGRAPTFFRDLRTPVEQVIAERSGLVT